MIKSFRLKGLDENSKTLREILEKYDRDPAEYQRSVAKDIETSIETDLAQ